MGITIRKLRRGGPSMVVPGEGTIEVPKNMEHTPRNGARNARHYADAMRGVGGSGKSVDKQYTGDGAQGDGDDS